MSAAKNGEEPPLDGVPPEVVAAVRGLRVDVPNSPRVPLSGCTQVRSRVLRAAGGWLPGPAGRRGLAAGSCGRQGAVCRGLQPGCGGVGLVGGA